MKNAERKQRITMYLKIHIAPPVQPRKQTSPENKRIITQSSETMYQNAVNKKLATMLKAPNTPLIAPPQIMRILVLPYKGDMNELYMMRYVYLLIDDPQVGSGQLFDRFRRIIRGKKWKYFT